MEMLKTLHIQNYRLFRDLNIEKIGQVNLIAGKNNSGKTALLEALMIYANEADKNILCYTLTQREELSIYGSKEAYNLFFDKSEKIVSIGDDVNRSVRFVAEEKYQKENDILCPLKDGAYDVSLERLPTDYSIFVPFHSKNDFDARLWEHISLTPKEDDVIEILRIIEPQLDKFRFDNRKAKILIKGQNAPIPLKKAGEGLNRLLSLALAIVSAKGKMLLIDEFEVGLHHSIQEKLWLAIFQYAKKWDIQVFVTTHSEDSVKAFYDVGSTPQYQNMVNFLTLKRKKNGDIEAINFDMEELETALLGNIELR